MRTQAAVTEATALVNDFPGVAAYRLESAKANVGLGGSTAPDLANDEAEKCLRAALADLDHTHRGILAPAAAARPGTRRCASWDPPKVSR